MATLSQVSLRQLILIGRKKEIGRQEVFHLISELVSATLELKQARGFSHGNLHAGNVFVRDPRRISTSEVLLLNPKPPESPDAQQNELSDLHQIGEILFKLVRHGDVSAAENWPVPEGTEWTVMFGKDAEKWRDLCNRLVDPNLSLADLSLEALREQLKEIKPPQVRGRSAVIIGAVAMALVAVMAVVIWIRHIQEGKYLIVRVETIPAGAGIKLVGYGEWTNTTEIRILRENIRQDRQLELALMLDGYRTEYPQLTNLTQKKIELGRIPLLRLVGTFKLESDLRQVEVSVVAGGLTNRLGQTPLTTNLPVGKYTVTGHYPHYPMLEDQRIDITVTRDETNSQQLRFPFGSLSVTSKPAGAALRSGTNYLGQTPYTNPFWPTGTVNITLRSEGYNDELRAVSVADRGSTNYHFELSQGTGAVVLTGLPPRTEIFDSQTNSMGLANDAGEFSTNLPVGTVRLLVRKDRAYHELPGITVEQNQRKTVPSPVRFARLVLSSTPSNAEILRNNVPLNGADGSPVRTPYTMEFHDPGTFDYTFTATNSLGEALSGRTNVTLAGADRKAISAGLSSGLGTLLFSVEPTNARLKWIAVTATGFITNLLWKSPPGKMQVVVEHDDLDRLTNDVFVDADRTKPVTIRIPHGSVVLKGEQPPGIKVFREVVGKPKEELRSPWSPQLVRPGMAKYDFEDPNRYFEPASTQTTVVDGGKHEVLYQLQRGRATLRFRGTRGDEILVVTNVDARLTPNLAALSPVGIIGADGIFKADFPAGLPYLLAARRGASIVWTKPIPPPQRDVDLTQDIPPPVQVAIADPTPLRTQSGPVRYAIQEGRTHEIILPGGVVMELMWVEPAKLYVGRYEVTQKQYQAVMLKESSTLSGDDLPVNNVSFNDAMQFCSALNDLGKSRGEGEYRLPTPQEWLVFAEGVSQFGDLEKMRQVGVFGREENEGPLPVGGKQPNKYGLYDLRGNVAEYCSRNGGPFVAGGDYQSPRLGSTGLEGVPGGTGVSAGRDARFKRYGFRVVLVPAGP